MEPDSEESRLIDEQFQRKASIFACDGFAVISSKRLVLGHIGDSPVETWWNPEEQAGVGKYGVDGATTDSFLNTRTFLWGWDTLINSGQIGLYDFVVKVDPDAVFFSERLREHMKDKVGQNIYVPNCGKYGGEGLLYGAIEVISGQAMQQYAQRSAECKALDWKGWGEDYYMQQCMNHLGVAPSPDYKQVGDDRCIAAECTDFSYIAFHPFKKVDEWVECYKAAITTTTTTTTITTTEVRGPKPWLFCWSHIEPGTYEEKLIKLQFARRANIFACNDFAVISSERIVLGEINGSKVETWLNHESKTDMGQYGVDGQKTDSYLNTKAFLEAWDSLLNSGLIWAFDFVVKVDPDAVFFPDRLRKHVKDKVGQSVYFPNCGKWGSGPKLYGSVEVISVPAMRTYQERTKDCKTLPWHEWGEDYYMQHCMDMIGVAQAPDYDQVGDERCVGASCSDWNKVAFHDYKEPDEWMKCFKKAIGEE